MAFETKNRNGTTWLPLDSYVNMFQKESPRSKFGLVSVYYGKVDLRKRSLLYLYRKIRVQNQDIWNLKNERVRLHFLFERVQERSSKVQKWQGFRRFPAGPPSPIHSFCWKTRCWNHGIEAQIEMSPFGCQRIQGILESRHLKPQN